MSWMNAHIDVCTAKLIYKWQQGTKTDGSFIIPHLEQDLYRWAIDGKQNKSIYFYVTFQPFVQIILVVCSIMFGSFATSSPQIEAHLNAFTHIVHKIFENSVKLMNFPPQLAKLLGLGMWQDFERNVAEVLQQGSQIIDMFLELSKEEEDYDGKANALFYMLHDAEMDTAMIKRIFVDLVIAAGDTVSRNADIFYKPCFLRAIGKFFKKIHRIQKNA